MTTASTPASMPQSGPGNDPLSLIDVDHVRFDVGNARQAAMFASSNGWACTLNWASTVGCGGASITYPVEITIATASPRTRSFFRHGAS